MRPIFLADLPGDTKTRPVVILTRPEVRPRRTQVTIAPITSQVRGLATEVFVGPRNGLDHESVINVDNTSTVHASALLTEVGFLHADQERDLARAIIEAFDLDIEVPGVAD